jgi:hypothetical protein
VSSYGIYFRKRQAGRYTGMFVWLPPHKPKPAEPADTEVFDEKEKKV